MWHQCWNKKQREYSWWSLPLAIPEKTMVGRQTYREREYCSVNCESKCNRSLERRVIVLMDCLEETKWRPWISTFSFHDFSSWGQRAFCEPLSMAVSYLFRIDLSQDWQLPYEERLGNLPCGLTAVNSKRIMSVDYFYFGISSYLIPGNVDRYQLPILQFYCSKEVINSY